MEKIAVSVICNTFNHGKYIREALEGFVNQKTNFVYEVLVYDDASTDNTADIIREYELKYPELIKPVYQTINQYSQGLKPGEQNRARAKGKYLALCEGDDYWIDNNKLQKQYDYMELHPECSFCFTNGKLRVGDEMIRKVVPWNGESLLKCDGNDYNVAELELLGYIPTASFFYPREYKKLEIPEKAFSGDTYHKLSTTMCGYAHYIPEETCVYRQGVDESETALWQKNVEKYVRFLEGSILLYETINKATNYKYNSVFATRICECKIAKFYSIQDFKELKKIAKSEEMKNFIYTNRKAKLYYNMKCRCPRVFTLLNNLRRKL